MDVWLDSGLAWHAARAGYQDAKTQVSYFEDLFNLRHHDHDCKKVLYILLSFSFLPGISNTIAKRRKERNVVRDVLKVLQIFTLLLFFEFFSSILQFLQSAYFIFPLVSMHY